MNQWLLVVLLILTVYRATHLLTSDTFPPIEAGRERVSRLFGEDSSVTYLSTCPWCMSVWLGALIVWVTDLIIDGGVPVPVLVWAAASGVTGFLASVEPD